VLGTRGTFAVLAGLVVGLVVVFVDLRVEILVFILVVKHVAIVVSSRNFGTVAEEDDATVAIVWPESAVQVHIDVIRRVVNAMVNAGTAELGYTVVLELN